MSQLDILKQYPEFNELYNFLICYFGDDREGKTEARIVAEFAEENSYEHVAAIQKILDQFIDSNLPLDTKHAIVDATNLYFESGQDAMEWIQKVRRLIEKHH